MKLIKKMSITFFIILVSLILINSNISISKGEELTVKLRLGKDSDWNRPFPETNKSNVYCLNHGDALPHSTGCPKDDCPLKHSSDGLWHFTKDSDGELTPGYAKALLSAEEESETPGHSFTVATGTDTWQGLIWEGINDSKYKYTNPDNPYIKFDNDNVSEKVKSIDKDYYVVKFSVKFGRGGTGAKVSEIKLQPDNNDEVNISNVYSDKNCEHSKKINEIVSGNTYYIKVKKSELKNSKTMKIYAKYKVKKTFGGTYTTYECRRRNTKLATFSNCKSNT